MESEAKDLEDFLEFFGGVERDVRPKKAKPLKNYITGYYEGIKHITINPHNVIKELENRDLLFVGLNGDVIYNF
jgi:hypothetical protein